MRGILAIIACLVMFSCGTKYNYLDTGTSNGRFEGSMYELLKSDPNQWDSIVKIIERADLVEIFEKEDITFFAPTNFIFWKWFYYDDKNGGYEQAVSYTPHGYTSISQIDPEVCKRIVLSHIVNGKIMRDDIPRVTFDEYGKKNGGGTNLTTRYGNKMWIWSIKEPYMNIPDMGPVVLDMSSLNADGTVNKNIGIASPDHEPDNGVLHSLPYTYRLGELCDVLKSK